MQSFCARYFQPELFPSIINEQRSLEYTTLLHSTPASEVDLAQRYLASFCPALCCGSEAQKEFNYCERKGRRLKTCRHLTMTGNHIEENSICEEAFIYQGVKLHLNCSQAQWEKMLESKQ